jgi:hypothetical protein
MDDRATPALLAGFGAGMWLLTVVFTIFYAICAWKIYEKAARPGWAAIIPIYNMIVLLEIVGKPLWWFLLFLVPGVNIVVSVLVYIELSKSFGKDTAFAIGLLLLSFIFYPILAFGSARYLGPGGRAPAGPITRMP